MLDLWKLHWILWTFGIFVYFHGSCYGHPLHKKGSMNGKRKPRQENPDKQHTELHITEDSTARITCKVDAAIDNATWFHNGTEIPVSDRFKLKPKSLQVMNITVTDAGVYSCRVLTAEGITWRNTTLLVVPEDHGRLPSVPQMLCLSDKSVVLEAYSPPEFTFLEGPPDKHEVTFVQMVNEPLRLPCCATGNPKPTISWWVNELPFHLTHPELGQESFKESDKDGSLITDHLEPTDTGNYTCKATNAHGEVTFKYNVQVEPRPHSGPPSIESDYPKNLDVIVGEKAEFRCKTKSSTLFDITWGRKVVPVNGSIDIELLVQAMDSRYKVGAADFTILNVTYQDAGQYFCIADNGMGKDISSDKNGHLSVYEIDEKPYIPLVGIPEHPATDHILYIALGAGLFFLLLVSLVVWFIYKQRKAHELAKKLQREEIPVHTIITPRRKIKITRRSSDRSEDSLLPRFCYEATIMPMDTESIVTSRATTISHCNSTIEYFCDFPVDQEWEFLREQLSFSGDGYGEELGKGAFGKVVKARAANIRGRPGISDVAVKMPKEPQSEDDEVSAITGLIEELEIMKIMNHSNVIQLLGCCSQLSEGPLFIIMEYAPYGNLKDFLRDYKRSRIENMDYEQPIGLLELTNRDLVTYATQIASGALYLAEKKFVHRDLAARNILVTENYVMKLADFGLSKDLWNQDYYRKTTKGLLPVKWMAPESFDENKYTTQSDVWSFGVLLWEIWSFGDTPYGDKIPLERLIVNIKAGTRLGKPEGCSPEIYRLMDDCWKIDPNDRPSFRDLLTCFEMILGREYLEVASPELAPFHVENPHYMYQLGVSRSLV